MTEKEQGGHGMARGRQARLREESPAKEAEPRAGVFPAEEGHEGGQAAGPGGEPGEPGLLARCLRIAEALLFASEAPLAEEDIAAALPEGVDVAAVMAALQARYEGAGVQPVRVAGKWQFRTAADLAHLLRKEEPRKVRLSRSALETLAVIAYHQPVTRAEIEDIRGVSMSRGVLDALLETGWVRIRGRRRSPGRPVTYGTTEAFLVHFGLDSIADLPGLSELKAAGLLQTQIPVDFMMPQPGAEEDALDPNDDGTLETADDDEEPPLEMHLPGDSGR
jgi:segregation and condensation protein B